MSNGSFSDTPTVLRWAADAAKDDPVVEMFWRKLCDAVNEPVDGTPERILSELCAYGGNSICNAFRDGGVPYPEVAWDVSETLRGFFEDRTCEEGDVTACERFALGKMAISSDDLEQLCAAVASRGLGEAVAGETARMASFTTARAVGTAAATIATKKAGEAVARKALAEAGRTVSKRAAQKAAEEVGKRVALQVLAQIAIVLNVIGVAWLLIDLAGPAKRVTIPGVVYVALLRKLHDSAHGE